MNNENTEQLFSGVQAIKKTKAYSNKQNEILNNNTYKVIFFKKNKPILHHQSINSGHILVQVSNSLNKTQQFKPDYQAQIDLDAEVKCFSIGRQDKEQVDLDNNYSAVVLFNRVVCPNEEMMSPFHLLVDYSNLICVMTLEDHCNQFIHQLYSEKNPKTISFKTMELIARSIYQNKQKIRIQDISSMRGYPTFIQITRKCENQILEDNNIFRVGYQPQLTVRKIYSKFLHFFQRYSSLDNLIDMVFEALQSLQSKVQFSGIDESISELFMHIQDRTINKAEYLSQLEEENLMIQSKLYAALEKNCILLQTQRDENPIEHFLLVADQKNKFFFGRMEFSDISFQSTQVSRNHGTIEFDPATNNWIIMDGQMSSDSWKFSTFGVWLEIKPKTFYYIDPDQIIKVGSTNIKLKAMNLFINQEDTDNENQMEKMIKKREQEIEDLKNELLKL
ncbi:unnamed protein product [Paramecium sonneborni]|uniref:FHA domain-containing protein n=1 Tax=Paramecium sonneborni TaxID=65129 RepID=A0A8S1QAQ0_9CILI|nr:unnamed protein product [Paramecium sonneborni]